MKQKTKKNGKRNKADWLERLVHVVARLTFLVVLVVLMAGMVRYLYRFGYEFFAEKPGNGVEITFEFTVQEGASAKDVAAMLKDKNLISSELTFLLQKALYEKEIYAGTHELHSNMTTLEILNVLSTPTEKTE